MTIAPSTTRTGADGCNRDSRASNNPLKEEDMEIIARTSDNDQQREIDVHMHSKQIGHVDDGERRTATYGYLCVSDTRIVAVVYRSDDDNVQAQARAHVFGEARAVQRGDYELPEGLQWHEDTVTVSWDDGRTKTFDCVKVSVIDRQFIRRCTTPACELYGDAHIEYFPDSVPIHHISLGPLVTLEQWDERPWSLRIDDAEIDELADMQALAEQVTKAAKLTADLNREAVKA